jgi:hypothetical protein
MDFWDEDPYFPSEFSFIIPSLKKLHNKKNLHW